MDIYESIRDRRRALEDAVHGDPGEDYWENFHRCWDRLRSALSAIGIVEDQDYAAAGIGAHAVAQILGAADRALQNHEPGAHKRTAQ